MSSQAILRLPPRGVRIVDGEPRYSAAYLDDDRPRDAMSALERARKAWARVAMQLEIDFELRGE